METKPAEANMEEYSASSTTIKFDYPIPLLRGPLRAGPHDDPSSGSYLLAFRSPQSWAAAFRSCESRIISQCEEGARIGCAISASNKCKPPWWRNLIGPKPMDLKEREGCEVREMETCLAVAKDKCVGFAKEKLLKTFRDARIAGRVSPKEVQKLVCLASLPQERAAWTDLIGLDRVLGDSGFGMTNYRASELLGSDSSYELFLK
ncbi:hypothetical protein ACOSP7_001446 [Xanthoceras sorbifolium]|uniref:Uncharacterized protein n=1 Tax=Xanthoceras sorbifolium TaxID=99658 RepID=A0ABQ8IMG6_9ROSI|nr:hypothetical protein JRO89_XS01G0272600 [Xanthoceras sorbifolium]